LICGREGGCLYVCREDGLLESDAKWDDPIGVGDAIAIWFAVWVGVMIDGYCPEIMDWNR
jgi:hypothetical protein